MTQPKDSVHYNCRKTSFKEQPVAPKAKSPKAVPSAKSAKPVKKPPAKLVKQYTSRQPRTKVLVTPQKPVVRRAVRETL